MMFPPAPEPCVSVKTPLIGFYGNGEIAPAGGRNRVLQYASVCGLIG